MPKPTKCITISEEHLAAERNWSSKQALEGKQGGLSRFVAHCIENSVGNRTETNTEAQK